MWYIIIGLLLIGLIIGLISWLFSLLAELVNWLVELVNSLAELVGGGVRLATMIIILVVAFLAFSWVGVLAVTGIAVVGFVLVNLFGRAGKFVSQKVEQHDNKANETARIKRQTQVEQQIHKNDYALSEELSKNCLWLGYMNADKWRKKLPNFLKMNYSSSFDTITANFAKQIEQQYIIQNNDWFEPYKLYVLNHPGGSTVTKMLNEVDCPQLKMTHITPDGDLINTWLVRGTKRVSNDVPELFRMTFIKDINENVFTPTEYLKKLYEDETSYFQHDEHVEEINFNEL